MKNRYTILIAAICLMLCGCNRNLVNKVDRSFDEKWDQVFANIHGSKYYGIEDEWIDHVDTVGEVGNGYGLLVYYHYGINERVASFYMDPSGKVAPADHGDPKSSGYPYITDMTYCINADGNIVFDWVAEISILAGCLLVLLWMFVCTPF